MKIDENDAAARGWIDTNDNNITVTGDDPGFGLMMMDVHIECGQILVFLIIEAASE